MQRQKLRQHFNNIQRHLHVPRRAAFEAQGGRAVHEERGNPGHPEHPGGVPSSERVRSRVPQVVRPPLLPHRALRVRGPHVCIFTFIYFHV